MLVAVHGAAGYHSFFLPRGASLVEVLPYKFARSWANQYYATMLELDKKVREAGGKLCRVEWVTTECTERDGGELLERRMHCTVQSRRLALRHPCFTWSFGCP